MRYLLLCLVLLMGCEAIEVETENIGDGGVSMDTVIACCGCPCSGLNYNAIIYQPVTISEVLDGADCYWICIDKCEDAGHGLIASGGFLGECENESNL